MSLPLPIASASRDWYNSLVTMPQAPRLALRFPFLLSIRCRAAFLTLLCAGALLAQGSGAARSSTAPLTQRRINAMAAALEQARHALIEEAGLRLPGEGLPTYLARIAAPLPGERAAAYKTRLDSYLAALDRAVEATAAARRMPRLRDESLENRRLWERAARIASYMPARNARLRLAWKRVANGAEPPSRRLPQELRASLNLVLSLLDALRDARP